MKLKNIFLFKGEVNTIFFFFVTVQVKHKYYKKIKVTSHLPFVRSENIHCFVPQNRRFLTKCVYCEKTGSQ